MLVFYSNILFILIDYVIYVKNIHIPSASLELEQKYGELISYFVSKNTNKEVRRFRKIIPPERISRLAEMLYSLTNSSSYNML